jgi:hypothetical protein
VLEGCYRDNPLAIAYYSQLKKSIQLNCEYWKSSTAIKHSNWCTGTLFGFLYTSSREKQLMHISTDDLGDYHQDHWHLHPGHSSSMGWHRNPLLTCHFQGTFQPYCHDPPTLSWGYHLTASLYTGE